MLLPVRDAAATLEAALASLSAQTFRDFEVVAVDDGSRDASPAILTSWAADDGRIRVHTTAARGIVAALEFARDKARGEFLARMDADDVARPERLARQVEAMQAQVDWGVCGTHVRIVPRKRLTAGRRRYEAWLNGLTTARAVERDVFVECPLAHPTWMLRADAVTAVGGYRDAGWAEDHDLLLRLRAAGWRLGVVPEVLLDWTDRPGRLSRTHPSYGPGAFVRARAHHLPRLHPRAEEGVVVWGAGPVGKAFARCWQAAGGRVVAFVELDPRKIGQTIHGAPVVAPDDDGTWRRHFVVAAVGQSGARARIRADLEARGLVDGRDFVAVA